MIKINPLLIKEAVIGSTTAFASIATTVGISALIFSGPLANQLPFGIYYGLISIVIATIIFAWKGSFSFAITGPDSRTGSVLAVMGLVAAERVINLPAEMQGPTLIMAMVMPSFICGVILYLIGVARLGAMVRFVPYTIIAGFLGASGWMLVLGTLRLISETGKAEDIVLSLADHDRLMIFVLTIVIAATINIINLKIKSVFNLPVILIVAILLIHFGLYLSGYSLPEARLNGWLLPELGEIQWVFPFSEKITAHVHWQTLIGLSAEFLVLTLVSLLILLLSVAAIEVVSNTEANADKELRVSGITNIITGLMGGMVNTISLSRTILHFRAGAKSRYSTVVSGIFALATILFGTSIISLAPVSALAGLLLVLGTGLIYDWLIVTYNRVALSDWIEIVAIQVIILQFGFVAGVFAGLVIACISFVFNFSKINLIKLNLSRSEYNSNVERSLSDNKQLAKEGNAIQIFWLQGFIFFGSANSLVSEIKNVIYKDIDTIRVIILDYQQVLGIDSSAIISFQKLLHVAEKEDLRFVLSSVPNHIMAQMHNDGLLKGNHYISVFENLDAALEWSEDYVLNKSAEHDEVIDSAQAWLGRELDNEGHYSKLKEYLELKTYQTDDYICRQGESADAMYFVISGRVTILLENGGTQQVRLRSFLGQTLVGEIGLFRKEIRTASVKVDKDARIFILTRPSMEKLKSEHPSIALALHEFVIRTIAARVGFANKEVAELNRG